MIKIARLNSLPSKLRKTGFACRSCQRLAAGARITKTTKRLLRVPKLPTAGLGFKNDKSCQRLASQPEVAKYKLRVQRHLGNALIQYYDFIEKGYRFWFFVCGHMWPQTLTVKLDVSANAHCETHCERKHPLWNSQWNKKQHPFVNYTLNLQQGHLQCMQCQMFWRTSQLKVVT